MHKKQTNKQKAVLFLHTSNDHLKRLLGKQVHLAPKIIKYLGINLSKDVKVLYAKTTNTAEEIKDDRNKWKDISLSWIRRQYF